MFLLKQATVVAVVSLLLASSLSGQSPAKRALVLEDYYRIKTIGDVSISPDGTRVSFTRSTRIEEVSR